MGHAGFIWFCFQLVEANEEMNNNLVHLLIFRVFFSFSCRSDC